MLKRKNELQIREQDLVERLDDASTTLHQISFEQSDGDPIRIFTDLWYRIISQIEVI